MIAFIVPFLVLAGVGFVISLVVHLIALSGNLPPGGQAVLALHGGVFVVWLPTMLVAMRLDKGQRTWKSWTRIFAGCPGWMRYAAVCLFGYAFLNFFLAFGDAPRQTIDGDLTPTVLRGFSGHWMLFYAIAFCILFSVYRKPTLLAKAKCPDGHAVGHSDRFCPSCGKALPTPQTDG